MHPILVMGAGSWGTALSIHLAKNGNAVKLWSHDPDIAKTLIKHQENTLFLPGFALDDSIEVTHELAPFFKQVGQDKHDVMLAIPSFAFADVLASLAPYKTPHTRLLWVTKGLSDNAELLHTLVEQQGYTSYGVMSGPSFAKEVALGNPTSVSLATTDAEFTQAMIKRFHHPHFRIYDNDDIIGVEIGGALKNVIAIAVALVDGLGYGRNAIAAMITRGLTDIRLIAMRLGATPRTLSGLSGLGDLVLTCSDAQSRNRRFGLNLAKGMPIEEAEKQVGQVVEGLSNTQQAYDLCEKLKLKAPVVRMMYEILYKHVPAKDAIDAYFNQPQSGEFV